MTSVENQLLPEKGLNFVWVGLFPLIQNFIQVQFSIYNIILCLRWSYVG